LMGDTTRTGGDQGGAIASEAGDAVDARGLKGFGEGHGRQDGGESPGQHRRARPRRAEQEHIMVRTPAWRSPSRWPTEIRSGGVKGKKFHRPHRAVVPSSHSRIGPTLLSWNHAVLCATRECAHFLEATGCLNLNRTSTPSARSAAASPATSPDTAVSL